MALDAHSGGQVEAPEQCPLPCLNPWAGHRWGCPDTPTWQVGWGSGHPLGQGGLGGGVTGKGVTAEHRQRGTRDPLLHSYPIPPHTSALAEVRALTQLSVGLGPSRRGWAQVPGGGFHLDSWFTGMGREWKRAREVSDACPSSQDVLGDVCEPG